MSPAHIEEAFNLLVAAAKAGERCPQSQPHGPLRKDAIPALCEAGRIRSEVYAKNWRVVTILTGEAKGKQTMAAPTSGPPYCINGRIPGRSRVAPSVRRHIRVGDGKGQGPATYDRRGGPAPISLANPERYLVFGSVFVPAADLLALLSAYKSQSRSEPAVDTGEKIAGYTTAEIKAIAHQLQFSVPAGCSEEDRQLYKAATEVIYAALARIRTLEGEVRRLLALINTPETNDWLKAVPLEAAHQIERWGSDHDAGKTAWDWFWLIGYLSQKAASSEVAGDAEKAKHHTISTAAALLNWHRRLAGENGAMRPGIDPIERGVA